MSGQYTESGKRRSSMTHANHSWTCPCGRKVYGNGGRSSHQRAITTRPVRNTWTAGADISSKRGS
jgi:hypothetical protein